MMKKKSIRRLKGTRRADGAPITFFTVAPLYAINYMDRQVFSSSQPMKIDSGLTDAQAWLDRLHPGGSLRIPHRPLGTAGAAELSPSWLFSSATFLTAWPASSPAPLRALVGWASGFVPGGGDGQHLISRSAGCALGLPYAILRARQALLGPISQSVARPFPILYIPALSLPLACFMKDYKTGRQGADGGVCALGDKQGCRL
jgi:hypothetical protein